jgi:hypothetical protein
VIREPEDLPMILPLLIPGFGMVEPSLLTLNTKGPHAASADAGLFLWSLQTEPSQFYCPFLGAA